MRKTVNIQTMNDTIDILPTILLYELDDIIHCTSTGGRPLIKFVNSFTIRENINTEHDCNGEHAPMAMMIVRRT